MSTQRDYRNRPQPLPKWASLLVECALIALVVLLMVWQDYFNELARTDHA